MAVAASCAAFNASPILLAQNNVQLKGSVYSLPCNFCRRRSVGCSRVLGVGAGVESRGRGRLKCRKGVRGLGGVRAGGRDGDNMDDEGVVKDMERYLNELAIEYDNVWDTKPAWCQPWTIVLTGVTGITLSWLVIHSTILTGFVAILVAAWWFIFLYSYPLAYTEMIAQRRKNQQDGLEDTFGMQRRNE